jgi:hypothetical protein
MKSSILSSFISIRSSSWELTIKRIASSSVSSLIYSLSSSLLEETTCWISEWNSSQQCSKRSYCEKYLSHRWWNAIWNYFKEDMIKGGKDRYHSWASPSNEYINIFMITSSSCIFNWAIHWWNLMRWSEGLSSFLSLNQGRQYPQIYIRGIGYGKLGTTENLRGANLLAKRAANAFEIWRLWNHHWILPSWSHQIEVTTNMMPSLCLSSKSITMSSPREAFFKLLSPAMMPIFYDSKSHSSL